MTSFFSNLIENILFIVQRITWLSVLDILLVTLIFFVILQLIRDTQGIVLIRGAIFLIVLFSILSSLEILPAFSWLIRNTLPAMLLAIPVIFAPEIRRTLERLGRAGTILPTTTAATRTKSVIQSVVEAANRLAQKKHGALIVFQRLDHLDQYIQSGVRLQAKVTPELILQIFYPNTPLHDGAVIIDGEIIVAAACVLPLSSSGVLTDSPDRQMGLRHRAALGISEVTDAVALVVSEETGSISIVDHGKMLRRLDPKRLDLILKALIQQPQEEHGLIAAWRKIQSIFWKSKET